jgi:hypothetical protein
LRGTLHVQIIQVVLDLIPVWHFCRGLGLGLNARSDLCVFELRDVLSSLKD